MACIFTFICSIILPHSFKTINMKKILNLLTIAFFSVSVNAQSTEDSVKATVNNLFTAMKNADIILLKSTFAEAAILQTITRNKEGETVVRTEEVKGFIDYVGKQPKGDADERITFGSIKIDGGLASVWTPYNFYAGGKFSHCGANSFQLVKLNGAWKIQYLIDTRRRQGCNP
jgi:hypothetical protein